MPNYGRRPGGVSGASLLSTASVDLCNSTYNATPGQDITAALQTALNWIAANSPNGGEIYFSKPGTYLINGAQQTGTAQSYSYSGQILIPAVALANSMPIRLRGAVAASGGGSTTGAPNGVILQSNATTGYVFDIIPSFTEFGCPWTGVMPIFENIIVRTSDDPTCGGLNMACTQRFQANRLIVDTPTAFTAPVTGSKAALVLPQNYNNGDVSLHNCTFRGYPIGLVLSEHAALNNVDVAYCLTAFKGAGRGHANWFGYVDAEECPTIFDGGSAPAFGSPAVSAGTVVYGFLDFENVNTGSLKPVNFVNDAEATNPVVGKLDVWGTIGSTYPTTGGRLLDVVPVVQPASLGPRQRGVGWLESHPFDNFGRLVALSGSGAPGQCNPSMHPWRVEAGSFSVSGGQLKGLSGADKCFVPVLRAGNFSSLAGAALSRTLTLKFTLGHTSPGVRLLACAAWNGTGAVNAGATAIELRLNGGATPLLRANNSNIVAFGSTLAVDSTHTAQLAVYHNAAGYPYACKVYIDGTAFGPYGIGTSQTSLGLSNPGSWPFYEDGIWFTDTGTAVTEFAVEELTADMPFVEAGTATLVAGTVTVSNTRVTANTVLRYWRTTAGGTLGNLSRTLSAGTSFTINSDNAADTSTIYYEIVSY